MDLRNFPDSQLICRGEYIFYQLPIGRNYVLTYTILHFYPILQLEKLDKSKYTSPCYTFFIFYD